jgi:oligoribonuclease (3'-5' exoribonuclease)
MGKYLSIDTEATGLEEHCLLIQVAVVPLDSTQKKIETALGQEVLIKCPSFEELKPSLSQWVLEHNEDLIRKAHKDGLTLDGFKKWMNDYMTSKPVRDFFSGERPPLLGKSLSALDIPMLTRYLGRSFMDKYFHHHTVDVTCIARFLVDSGQLPRGCQSTTKLLQHFAIRDISHHTALSDAVDMAEVYLKLLSMPKPTTQTTP